MYFHRHVHPRRVVLLLAEVRRHQLLQVHAHVGEPLVAARVRRPLPRTPLPITNVRLQSRKRDALRGDDDAVALALQTAADVRQNAILVVVEIHVHLWNQTQVHVVARQRRVRCGETPLADLPAMNPASRPISFTMPTPYSQLIASTSALRMARVHSCTAVSKPKLRSTIAMSLSIVLGMPPMLIARCYARVHSRRLRGAGSPRTARWRRDGSRRRPPRRSGSPRSSDTSGECCRR